MATRRSVQRLGAAALAATLALAASAAEAVTLEKTLQATYPLPEGRQLHLWTGTALADAAIEAGLFGWLMERSR